MTEFFQNLGMSYNAAWLTATIAGILLIALPLMLSVAMIIYADRKIWAAMALRRPQCRWPIRFAAKLCRRLEGVPSGNHHTDRKSTRLNSSHERRSRMPSSA